MLFSLSCWSQQEDEMMVILPGTNTPQPFIGLDEVVVYRPIKLNSYEKMREYAILKRRTLKVYPYATLASDRFTTLKARLDLIKGKRKKKRYTKTIEKYIEGEFSEELKKLTRSEGQILVKLIHRETDITTHSLIKTYRNGWRAMVYQLTAKLFDIDLKAEFDPQHVKEDLWIEDILVRSGVERKIDHQKSTRK